MTIAAVLRDTGKTALNGVIMFAAVIAVVIIGPHVELALMPPVRIWEVHDARFQAGEVRWSVLIAQRRRCIPTVTWRLDGAPLAATGPALMLTPGEAAELGPFSAPIPAGVELGSTPRLSVSVVYNCGAPWGLAPIEHSVPVR